MLAIVFLVLFEDEEADAGPRQKDECLIDWDHSELVIESDCKVQELKLCVTREYNKATNKE